MKNYFLLLGMLGILIGSNITLAQQSAPGLERKPLEQLPVVTNNQRVPSASVSGFFQKNYEKAGNPKIAIFLNRKLSDEVREWKTEQRSVISGDGAITTTNTTPFSSHSETVKGNLSGYEQYHIEDKERKSDLSENFLWDFENGFMQPFLSANAYLVDRTTIMRLVALDSGQGDAYSPLVVKAVEMKSLINHADIFVELLITPGTHPPYEPEYRAVAKEVKTGRILANVTSNSLKPDHEQYKILADSRGYQVAQERSAGNKPTKVIATSTGYEFAQDPTTPEDISVALAEKMMAQLASIWGGDKTQ